MEDPSTKNPENPPIDDGNQEKSVDELFDQMEKYAQMDHERNAKFRRRLVFLLPYNLLLLFGSVKYAKNIHKISRALWPNRRKFTLGNFIFVGTVQALFFTSIFALGNWLIMGINPLKPQEIFQDDAEFVEGSSSIVVMKALKYVGLSDDTLKRIEEDLKKASKEKTEDLNQLDEKPVNEAEEIANQIKEDRKLT